MPPRLFPSPEYPDISTSDGALYPARRVFCVRRNYVEHAKEMGFEVDREAPFYFMKDASGIVQTGATIPYPPGTENFHYEMELVLAIGAAAFRADDATAAAAIWGFGCGLDLTRRDLQISSREKGRPWDFGKNFEHAAVIAPLTPVADFGKVGPQRIMLSVSGEARQNARLSDLVWSPEEIVGHLSRYYHLAPGDLIYTGTPAGVGPVVSGDVLHGEIDGLAPIDLTIGPAE